MRQGKLVQYGWLSGPVDCCCSECDWASSFNAVDASIPSEVQADFDAHDCNRPHTTSES